MNARFKNKQNHRLSESGKYIREVMLDKNGNVLPVVSATRISYDPDKVTTYQKPDPEGYVVKAIDINGDCEITVNRYIPKFDTVTEITDNPVLVKGVLSSIDPILKLWLEDVVTRKMSNLLPSGYGWDGVMTSSEYNKHSKVRDLFIAINDWEKEEDRVWFDEITNEIVKTSSYFINLDWDDALPLTGNSVTVKKFFEDTNAWLVCFDKDNKRSLIKLRRTIGAKAPVLESTHVISDDIERVIVLSSGCMLENGETYGCGVILYERKR